MDRVGVGGFRLRRCVIGLVQYRVPANFLGRDGLRLLTPGAPRAFSNVHALTVHFTNRTPSRPG